MVETGEVTVTVKGDLSELEDDLDEAQSMGEDLEDIEVSITGDASALQSEIDDTRDSLDNLTGDEYSVSVTADASEAQSQIDETQASADALGNTQANVQVHAEGAAEAKSEIDSVGESLESIKGMMETAGKFAIFSVAVAGANMLADAIQEDIDKFAELESASTSAAMRAKGETTAEGFRQVSGQIRAKASTLAVPAEIPEEQIAQILATYQNQKPIEQITAEDLERWDTAGDVLGTSAANAYESERLLGKQFSISDYDRINQAALIAYQQTGLNVTEMGQMGARIAPYADQLGGLEGTLATIGVIKEKSGLNSRIIASAIPELIQQLDESSAEVVTKRNKKGQITSQKMEYEGMGEILSKAGLDVATEKAKPLQQVLKDLKDRGVDLKTAFGGTAGVVADWWAKSGGAISTTTDKIKDGQDVVEAMGEAIDEDITEKMEKAKIAADALGTAIGEEFAPAEEQFLDYSTKIVQALTTGLKSGDWSEFSNVLSEILSTSFSFDQNSEAYRRLHDSIISAIESIGPIITNTIQNGDWAGAGTLIGTIIGTNIGTALTLAWDGAQWLENNSGALLDAAAKLGMGIAHGIAAALKHSSGFRELVDVGVTAFNALGSAATVLANAIGSTLTGAIKETIYAFADLVAAAETGINWAQSKLGLSGESAAPSASATPSTMYRDKITGKVVSSDKYREIISESGALQARRYEPIPNQKLTIKSVPGSSNDYMESLATKLKESGYDVHVAPAQVLGTGITVQNIWNGEGYIKDADKIAATDDSLDRLKQGWFDTAWSIAAPLAGNSPAVQETFDSAKKEIQSIPESQRTTTQNSILAGIENREKIQNTIDGGLDEVGDKLDNLAETGRSTEPSEKTGTPWADEIRSKADKLVWEDRTWKNIESPTVAWELEEQLGEVKGIMEETGWAWDGLGAKTDALRDQVSQTTAALAKYDPSLNMLAANSQSLADSMEGCDCALSDFAEAQEARTDLFLGGYIGPSGENYLGFLQQEAQRGAYHPTNIQVGFDYEEGGKAYMDQLAQDLQDDSKWSTTVKVDTTQADADLDNLDNQLKETREIPISADGTEAFNVIEQIRADAAAGATMPIYSSGGGGGGGSGNVQDLFDDILSATWNIPSFAEGSYVPSPTLAVVGDRPGGEIVAGLDQLRGMFQPGSVTIDARVTVQGSITGVDFDTVLEARNEEILRQVGYLMNRTGK